MICPSSISIDADHQMGRVPKPRRTELDQDLLSPRNDTPYSNSHLVLLKPGLATQRTLGSAHIFLQLFFRTFCNAVLPPITRKRQRQHQQ